jgi:hypothetical protein
MRRKTDQIGSIGDALDTINNLFEEDGALHKRIQEAQEAYAEECQTAYDMGWTEDDLQQFGVAHPVVQANTTQRKRRRRRTPSAPVTPPAAPDAAREDEPGAALQTPTDAVEHSVDLILGNADRAQPAAHRGRDTAVLGPPRVQAATQDGARGAPETPADRGEPSPGPVTGPFRRPQPNPHRPEETAGDGPPSAGRPAPLADQLF